MVKMSRLGLIAGIALPAMILAGCATNYDVDGVAAMAGKGDAFESALHKRYIERARFEVGEEDWLSVDFFNTRAEMAAMGKTPAVQAPDDRRLKADAGAIKSAYGRLTTALGTNAPKVTPDACARAQTWFEHWMEQAEEGHQDDHIAWTRGEYEKAIPECKAKMAEPKPAPAPEPMMPVPGPFVVYFDFDSAKLDSEAMGVIKKAGRAAGKYGPSAITVQGHTDTSGGNDYNAKLANKRARIVAEALENTGTKAEIEVLSYGETKPAKMTGDEIRERMNRRVEITFKEKK